MFDLAASYDNETRLSPSPSCSRRTRSDLAANLLNIPGTPQLRLSVEGDGPIDAFSAEIALSTDGQPRLTGTVATTLFPEPACAR